jgi:branched-chain amino acid transport system permease protein
MTTSFSDRLTTEPTRRDRRWLSGRGWPVGLAVGSVVVFLFYWLDLLGWIPEPIHGFIADWAPISKINVAIIWAMAALGLNIVVGYAGLLDLGFVAFWAIGGYVAGWIMSPFFANRKIDVTFLGTHPAGTTGGIHVNFFIVLVIGAGFCALWGFLIGAPTLRLRSDYLALVTLGFGEIIPEIFRNGDNIFGGNYTNGTQGIAPVDPVRSVSFGLNGVGVRPLLAFDDLSRYLIFIVLGAVIIFISLRLREGRLGRAWLAIREDELAASAMGVPLMRTKLAAYAIGAVAGGIAGVAYALQVNGVIPDTFDFSISINLLAMVVLGGMGNIWGVIVGALLLQMFNAAWLPQMDHTVTSLTGKDINLTSYSYLIFGSVLVGMMLFRREGILPEARTRLVLREPGRTEREEMGADLEAEAPELDALQVREGEFQHDPVANPGDGGHSGAHHEGAPQ